VTSDQLASGMLYAFDRPMNYSYFILLGNCCPGLVTKLGRIGKMAGDLIHRANFRLDLQVEASGEQWTGGIRITVFRLGASHL
jgi:hypothetical protein